MKPENSMLPALKRRLVDAMATFAKAAGMASAIEGRLLGHLILSDRPLCQDDLMKLAHCSRGNVSMALKALVEGGVVRASPGSPSRRLFYSSHPDLWQATIRYVIGRFAKQVDVIDRELATIVTDAREAMKEVAPGPELSEVRDFLSRIERLNRHIRGAKNLLRMVRALVDRGA